MAIYIISPKKQPSSLALPCFITHVRTGFPSPAEDYMDKALDLNEFLIQRPAATFYCWTEGESMEGAGIFDGDLLVVDRSEEPRHNDIVLAWVEEGLTCKRLDKHNRQLCAAHPDYPNINADAGVEIEGVVVSSIRFHRVRPR